MDAHGPARLAQLLVEHRARERAGTEQMLTEFKKAQAERARLSAAYVRSLQDIEFKRPTATQEDTTEKDATPAPEPAAADSPRPAELFEETEQPRGWSPLGALPPPHLAWT